MKTLYSSTFLSAVLAFLVLLGQSGTPVNVVQNEPMPSYQTIVEPMGPFEKKTEGPVALEVFSSFECAECTQFALGTLPTLREKYETSDLINFQFHLIPDKASEAQVYATRGAYCASKYDGFWTILPRLYQADILSKREVDLIGQELGFPVVEFRNCLNSDTFDAQIESAIFYSQQKGIQQKPTILVGSTLLLGAQPIENIERVLNKYLNN